MNGALPAQVTGGLLPEPPTCGSSFPRRTQPGFGAYWPSTPAEQVRRSAGGTRSRRDSVGGQLRALEHSGEGDAGEHEVVSWVFVD